MFAKKFALFPVAAAMATTLVCNTAYASTLPGGVTGSGTDPFQVLLTETGGGSVNALSGGGSPYLLTAATPTGDAETWVFTLPELVGTGDIYILDANGQVSDLLRFSASATSPLLADIGSEGTYVWLFSEGSPFLPASAAGVDPSVEITEDPSGVAFWQPGDLYPTNNEYTINSDVPDGGTTVMLLGAALSGLCLFRKKFMA